jgi:hypothetical protein
VFSTDLAGSASSLTLAGGATHMFPAMLDTATAGMFSATYTLMLSDENITGALCKSITLTLSGDVSAPTILAGNCNGDGTVDVADYTVCRDALDHSVAAFSGTDRDGDGMIPANDDQDWSDNFGQALTSGGAGAAAAHSGAVAEPASLAMLAAGTILTLAWLSSKRAA